MVLTHNSSPHLHVSITRNTRMMHQKESKERGSLLVLR